MNSNRQIRPADNNTSIIKRIIRCITFSLVRNQILFENTLFQCVAYHPEEYHIITGDSDRKISYGEITHGAQIRELETSKSGRINGLDIHHAGNYFVTVSVDKLVEINVISFSLIKKLNFYIWLWRYNEADLHSIGHGSELKDVKICPNKQHIISLSVDGSIFR